MTVLTNAIATQEVRKQIFSVDVTFYDILIKNYVTVIESFFIITYRYIQYLSLTSHNAFLKSL